MGSRAPIAIVGAVLVLLPLTVWASCLTNSAHDMTSRLTAQEKAVWKGSALCVFCHTPINVEAGLPSPAWRHDLSMDTPVPSVPLGQRPLSPVSAPGGGGSYLCLTCHDGVQAINVSLRPEGSVTGSQTHHPVGVPYGGTQGIPNRLNTYDLTRKGFAMPTADVIDGEKRWWLDTDNVSIAGQRHRGQSRVREKSDVFLFAIRGEYGNDSIPYVECASCHDPHQCETESFLRIDNARSALCMTCHLGL